MKVALAFDFQFVDSVPAIAKDMPKDVVGTEERVPRSTKFTLGRALALM